MWYVDEDRIDCFYSIEVRHKKIGCSRLVRKSLIEGRLAIAYSFLCPHLVLPGSRSDS